VKWFFDTSALYPVFIDDHNHHEASLAAYLRADPAQGACAAHSLAEVYATLTRMPGPNRLSADQVLLALDGIRERLTVIALDPEEYRSAIGEAAAEGILGGTVYDALIARCALKSKAAIIYTWNLKDFRRCGPDVARRVRTP
jgi:predicted nucleic acid-binding protein